MQFKEMLALKGQKIEIQKNISNKMTPSHIYQMNQMLLHPKLSAAHSGTKFYSTYKCDKDINNWICHQLKENKVCQEMKAYSFRSKDKENEADTEECDPCEQFQQKIDRKPAGWPVQKCYPYKNCIYHENDERVRYVGPPSENNPLDLMHPLLYQKAMWIAKWHRENENHLEKVVRCRDARLKSKNKGYE